MKVLVFAPHPDDGVIGCGGSLAKYNSKGDETAICYMTYGEGGTQEKNKKPEEVSQKRKEEARKSSKVLGVENTFFLGLSDGNVKFNKNSFTDVMEIIRSYKPEIVYVPHSNENDRDHRITRKIVMEAVFKSPDPTFPETGNPFEVKNVLSYEVWTPIQNPSYFEEVENFIAKKEKALRSHSSQTENLEYVESIRGLNKYRALGKKSNFCEAFKVLKLSDFTEI